MVIIRRATPEDAPAIARIEADTYQEAYRGIIAESTLSGMRSEVAVEVTGDFIRRAHEKRHIWLVATSDDEVVGFAHAGPAQYEEGDAEVYSLYVRSRMQRRGTGTRLMMETAKILEENGYIHLLAWVLRANPARSFYEKLGGELAGRRTWESRDQKLPMVSYRWVIASLLQPFINRTL